MLVSGGVSGVNHKRVAVNIAMLAQTQWSSTRSVLNMAIAALEMFEPSMSTSVLTVAQLAPNPGGSKYIDTSSSRASRGRKFQKKKELYSKERICL